MSAYYDIEQLSRPQYSDLQPMPMSKRAAQFAPFAALTGFDDVIAEIVKKSESEAAPAGTPCEDGFYDL